jgi:hypothetical protein
MTANPGLTNPRIDLIRRLFPMAISIGFAGPLVQISWLTNGHLPTSPEFQQLGRLFLSMLFVIMSWDWFHKDIVISPPRTLARFLLDVSIVLAYMIFLICARNHTAWLVTIVLVFFLYVLWDFFSILEVPETGLSDIIKRYGESFARNPSQIDVGPAINLCWFLYFVTVLGLQIWHGYAYPWLTFLLLLVSFVIVRFESNRFTQIELPNKGTRIVTYGFSTIRRLLVMRALLTAYATWVYLLPLPSSQLYGT